MRTLLGLLFIVVVIEACGGTPATPPAVVQDRDAGAATPVVTASDAGTSTPEPSTPEVAALKKCDASDRELTAALDSTRKLAAKGPIADRALLDALASCFERARTSSESSSNLARDMVQLFGEMRLTQAVRPLVTVLFDDKKADLVYTIGAALAKMPKEAEPLLITALAGSDPELAQLASKSNDEAWIPRVSHALAAISRPAGRDAIIDALAKTRNDTTRAVLALDLTRFPTTARSTKAFEEAAAKISDKASLTMYGGANARGMLAGAAPGFLDPELTNWLLAEHEAATYVLHGMDSPALGAAIKTMSTTNANKVGAAVKKLEKGNEATVKTYDNALALVNACKKDVRCYLKELEKPVPTSKLPADRIRHVKAAYMAGVHGDASTRGTLVERLNGLRDGTIRLAIVDAIDHLSPNGDVATADKLDALVGTDRASAALAGIDDMANLALRLRARASQ